MLHLNGEDNRITAFDGRETAPAASTPDMFLNADGSSKGFFEAVVGGLSVGVPGGEDAQARAQSARQSMG